MGDLSLRAKDLPPTVFLIKVWIVTLQSARNSPARALKHTCISSLTFVLDTRLSIRYIL
jgi:hypothetical protein